MRRWYVFRCKDPRFEHSLYAWGTAEEARQYFELAYDPAAHLFLACNFGLMSEAELRELDQKGQRLVELLEEEAMTLKG